jgi:drug/metabolite transporter (DMT)-like permease
VIFGLGAALGWGSADLLAAASSRRVGAFRTVVVAQVASAIAISGVVLLARPDLDGLVGIVWWLVPNSFVTACAYLLLYRALELGPVHVVSPVLAAYAVIPVLLAVALLHETLRPITAFGAAVTIGGAVLSSADLRSKRAGTQRMPRALPWAIGSAALFGIATYALGWAARRAGWLPSLWFSRTSAAFLFLVTAGVPAVHRSRIGASSAWPGAAMGIALVLALADISGTASFGYGAEVGLISIVTAVSATYPLIPVIGAIFLFGERPAPNQYVGVALVVAGLILLGLEG